MSDELNYLDKTGLTHLVDKIESTGGYPSDTPSLVYDTNNGTYYSTLFDTSDTSLEEIKIFADRPRPTSNIFRPISNEDYKYESDDYIVTYDPTINLFEVYGKNKDLPATSRTGIEIEIGECLFLRSNLIQAYKIEINRNEEDLCNGLGLRIEMFDASNAKTETSMTINEVSKYLSTGIVSAKLYLTISNTCEVSDTTPASFYIRIYNESIYTPISHSDDLYKTCRGMGINENRLIASQAKSVDANIIRDAVINPSRETIYKMDDDGKITNIGIYDDTTSSVGNNYFNYQLKVQPGEIGKLYFSFFLKNAGLGLGSNNCVEIYFMGKSELKISGTNVDDYAVRNFEVQLDNSEGSFELSMSYCIYFNLPKYSEFYVQLGKVPYNGLCKPYNKEVSNSILLNCIDSFISIDQTDHVSELLARNDGTGYIRRYYKKFVINAKNNVIKSTATNDGRPAAYIFYNFPNQFEGVSKDIMQMISGDITIDSNGTTPWSLQAISQTSSTGQIRLRVPTDYVGKTIEEILGDKEIVFYMPYIDENGDFRYVEDQIDPALAKYLTSLKMYAYTTKLTLAPSYRYALTTPYVKFKRGGKFDELTNEIIERIGVKGGIGGGDDSSEEIEEIKGDLGGVKFGKDGDGNPGYYGADGSLVPFRDAKFIFFGYGNGRKSTTLGVPQTCNYFIDENFITYDSCCELTFKQKGHLVLMYTASGVSNTATTAYSGKTRVDYYDTDTGAWTTIGAEITSTRISGSRLVDAMPNVKPGDKIRVYTRCSSASYYGGYTVTLALAPAEYIKWN